MLSRSVGGRGGGAGKAGGGGGDDPDLKRNRLPAHVLTMARSPTPTGQVGRTIAALTSGRASTIGLQGPALARRRRDVRRWRREQREAAQVRESGEASCRVVTLVPHLLHTGASWA